MKKPADKFGRLTEAIDRLEDEKNQLIATLKEQGKIIHEYRGERRAGANLVSSVRSVIVLCSASDESVELMAIAVLLADALQSSNAGTLFGQVNIGDRSAPK
jgi:hypothetical protein